MTAQMKSGLHIVLMLLGLLLIIGGIDTGKFGTVIIGCIVLVMNARVWMTRKKAA